ncbi:unknown [Crocosphaera subtropica ATCC 51142]|uniref:Permease n=2 Tax=Crocosphaera TaxID=263510 RepID=B1WYI2_CROS5|nr:unknown [Crocosphaera subtropica ATCC 51142]
MILLVIFSKKSYQLSIINYHFLNMSQLNYIYTLFISNLLISLPFLLLGIVVSSGLLVFIDEHQLVAKLPRTRILAVIIGSSLGFLLPLGQYGNLPIVRRLLLQGLPIPLCISFLIASPTVNPFVISNSWEVLGDHPRLVFLRILGAWLIAIIVGLIFSAYPEKSVIINESSSVLQSRSTLVHSGTILAPSEEFQPFHRAGNLIYEYQGNIRTSGNIWQQLSLFVENIIKEFIELGSILTVGVAISTTCQFFLPQAQLFQWGENPLNQILIMIVFGLLLSLNSLGSAYFLTPVLSSVLYGSAFVFLLLNSLFNISSLILLLGIIRIKFASYIFILTAQLILVLGLVLNFYIS